MPFFSGGTDTPSGFGQPGGSAGSAPPPGSGLGAGSGAGGAGGNNSAPPNITPGSSATAGLSTGIFGIFQTASARIERGPGVPVDPKAIVTLRPITSAGAANTQNVFVAIGPGDAAKNGNRITLVPTANPITVRVRNLNDIQLFGTVTGEGISIDIQEG